MRILLLLIFLSSLLFSDHNYEDTKERKIDIHMPYNMEYLNLSIKQKEQIRNLLKLSKKRYKKLHKRTEATKYLLVKLFSNKKFDKDKFVKLQLQLKKEGLQIEADLLWGLHQILTQKQRKKFIYYLKEWEIE
jgi:Spy/CpxP family protein refolding chaperone